MSIQLSFGVENIGRRRWAPGRGYYHGNFAGFFSDQTVYWYLSNHLLCWYTKCSYIEHKEEYLSLFFKIQRQKYENLAHLITVSFCNLYWDSNSASIFASLCGYCIGTCRSFAARHSDWYPSRRQKRSLITSRQKNHDIWRESSPSYQTSVGNPANSGSFACFITVLILTTIKPKPNPNHQTKSPLCPSFAPLQEYFTTE